MKPVFLVKRLKENLINSVVFCKKKLFEYVNACTEKDLSLKYSFPLIFSEEDNRVFKER